MSKAAVQTLPFAPDRTAWSWLERSELGVHGAADVAHRVPALEGEDGVELPERLRRALPLLLHEQPGLAEAGVEAAALRRVLPRLRTFRYVEAERAREFVFAAGRPSSLHVLGRVLGTSYRFRLEDLSHFATHGELVVEALDRLGVGDALDPEAILYCPAIDSPYPFKFFVVGQGGPNRATYLRLLSRILRQTEPDETFRARQFRELARGFQKFGPAAATPKFQEVELRLWRLLSYLAARLRVKAGRLTDTKDPDQARQFLAELRDVHGALDDLEHLPSRLAALFRSRFDLELDRLADHVFPELDQVARRLDCDLADRDRSIDAIAAQVAEFRRLGGASPLETLEEKDREIMLAYGDVEPEPLERGWARTYTDAIHTGAARFDERRFGAERGALALGDGEEDLDLELDFLARPAAPAHPPAADDEPTEPDPPAEEAAVDDEEAAEEHEASSAGLELSDSADDWRVQPGAEWSIGAMGETDIDLDAILGSDDGSVPPSDDEDEGRDD
ncbi:MAG: hypothetical protein KF878_25215 [Planctomycetes bacterium]|nr:hypothetical protein [Planctomycetota bacterium]